MSADAPMRLWFERSPIGMFCATKDGRFYDVNPAMARMLGYEVAELLEKNLTHDIYIDPNERHALHEVSWEAGRCDGALVHWRHRDGRTLAIQLWGHIIKTEDPPCFEAWAIDVTEQDAELRAQRRQREDLESTAKTLDLVVQQMPAIYWVLDRELRVLHNGGAIERVLGYSGSRYSGRTIEEIYDMPDEWTFDPRPLYQEVLAGKVVQYESQFRGKVMSCTLSPYRDPDGTIQGVIGTSIDVTSPRTLERRMIDAQRAESLGVLAGGLAHDFNNLLAAVIGNAELAQRELPPGAPGRFAIENIRAAGLRGAELIDQLLTFAGQAGAGNTRIAPAPVVGELLRIVAPTIPEGVAIAVDIPPDVALRGEPAQLRQVLLNLIANARDAVGAAGRITIAASTRRHDGAPHDDDVLNAPFGPYVVLEVADDGPGFDRETRRHVFEPFFTTKPAGHGLGLAAVLGIVRAHGGGVRATATPGAGARFQVFWPAATQATPAEAAAVAPTPAEPAPVTPPAPRPAAPTVLVVDDEALVRDVVARMLEDLGYAAITAHDGEAALDLLGRRPVDALLVDLTMPRMSGAQVIAAVRRDHPELPIVLCSGFDRDAHGPLRADAYLRKPFRFEALEQTLAKLLSSRGP